MAAIATGDPSVLTGTGLAIWNLLTTPRRVSDLVREVSVAYGTTPAAVEADVRSFVAELTLRGLVEEVGDGIP
jgi:hypothetical protein